LPKAATRAPRFRFGVDIGGTFTDLVLLEENSGRMLLSKTLTTPSNPSDGVMTGLRELLQMHTLSAEDLSHGVHATTLITNALIERKGARTGLITTLGFKDVIQVARELRYDMYDLFLKLPPPLVSRELTREVSERVASDGTVIDELDDAGLRGAADNLVASGVESIAVVFINSHRFPDHERRAGELISGDYPAVSVSLSHRIAPEIREYERTSTTVANAYVQPAAARYLGDLETRLQGNGYSGNLYMMLSSGGITSVQAACELPIALTESGPAAGALVAGFYGQLSGESHVMAFDMGGTTAKACIVDDGRPITTFSFEAGRVDRFKKGSGLPLMIPAVGLIEIGAGGGSIARLDDLGLLKVGPESAGASPGPACYGLGGTGMTVTDADLALGYLNADYFLGGDMGLDREATNRALNELAKTLQKDSLAVAWGIHEIVNENMASAARVHFAERGKDPRGYTLVATGGAGPVHAYQVARKLRLGRILCPLGSGLASTLGLLVAQPHVDLTQAYFCRLGDTDWDEVNRIYAGLLRRAEDFLVELGVPAKDINFEPTADMRYVGQGFEVSVPLPRGPYTGASAGHVRAAFEEAYRSIYGHTALGVEVEALTWRLRASGPPKDAQLVAAALSERGRMSRGQASPTKGHRDVYFAETGGLTRTVVLDRYGLAEGKVYKGPAIVEERESTVVVGPSAEFYIDAHLTLVMSLLEGPRVP
jgi:N-methylhydantoinase A